MKRKGLLNSTLLIAFNRSASCILGFIRDIVLAMLFGSSMNFDAYIIASHLPSFISYAITESCVTRSFIPLLSEKQTTTNPQEKNKFISQISGLLLFSIILLVAFSIIFAPLIIKIFAPGFIGNYFHSAVVMFRIMAISILLSTITAFWSGILNTLSSYGLPSLTPIITNLLLIIAAVYLSIFFQIPVYSLACAITIANILQCIVLFPAIHKKNMLIKPTLAFSLRDNHKFIRLIMPAFIGVSILQAGVMIDFIFASYLPSGSITWLYYSTRLMELPLSIFGIGIITVMLPSLSRSAAKKNSEEFGRVLNWSITLTFLIGVPASAGLFCLAGPIVITLFHHGLFNTTDTVMTIESTKAFAIGIIGFMLTKVCASAFYAKQDTKTPAKIAGIALLTNILFDFLLVFHFAHVGLALATSISGILSGVMLFGLLIKNRHYILSTMKARKFAQITAATCAMLLILKITMPASLQWLHQSTEWQIQHLLLGIVSGVMVYAVVLYGFGLRSASIFFSEEAT